MLYRSGLFLSSGAFCYSGLSGRTGLISIAPLLPALFSSQEREIVIFPALFFFPPLSLRFHVSFPRLFHTLDFLEFVCRGIMCAEVCDRFGRING